MDVYKHNCTNTMCFRQSRLNLPRICVAHYSVIVLITTLTLRLSRNLTVSLLTLELKFQTLCIFMATFLT